MTNFCFAFYVIDKNHMQHGGNMITQHPDFVPTLTTGKCQQKCRTLLWEEKPDCFSMFSVSKHLMSDLN